MSDCVPYAIHTATGIAFDVVLEAARWFGWSSQDGMTAVAGWCLLRELGVEASSMRRPGNRATLAAFLPQLDPQQTYIVDVTGHWFAVVKGIAIDKAKTHPRTVVRNYIELA